MQQDAQEVVGAILEALEHEAKEVLSQAFDLSDKDVEEVSTSLAFCEPPYTSLAVYR